jgi:hypothetical protein
MEEEGGMGYRGELVFEPASSSLLFMGMDA